MCIRDSAPPDADASLKLPPPPPVRHALQLHEQAAAAARDAAAAAALEGRSPLSPAQTKLKSLGLSARTLKLGSHVTSWESNVPTKTDNTATLRSSRMIPPTVAPLASQLAATSTGVKTY
eukprot:3298825-Prymnesium_polylepis.1